ncbi:Cai-1 autoinducer sensor kinase/phosphatase cqss [Plakobranchus ocellatus]|uniref:Cai-1 autoinducer sensor kinase/phosphatase cqss n=1 Tax=Plakobranchus ocellatus TaxID=259542 RepID=A0AAV4CSG0_9GAST|nr:Cai-1 autoinducer sensor kinase/phosphatase cqss [Plakobranchus ocellatus]
MEYKKDFQLRYSNDEVFTSADLQKVVMLPQMECFKEATFTRRLTVFNETFAELGSGKRNYAAVWHGGISGRKDEDLASTFHSCLPATAALGCEHWLGIPPVGRGSRGQVDPKQGPGTESRSSPDVPKMRPLLRPFPTKVNVALALIAFFALGYALVFKDHHSFSSSLDASLYFRLIRNGPHRHIPINRPTKGHEKAISSKPEVKSNLSAAPASSTTGLKSSKSEWNPNLALLTSELKKKLDVLEPEREIINMTTACNDYNIKYKDTCGDSDQDCPQKVLPKNLEDRIKQLTLRPNLQVPLKYRNVISGMAAAIPGHYDIILLSAISSNHFREAQAMFKNMHEKVLPILKNFTFVVYDLGLTDAERNEVITYCRCTVLKFPFHRFPEHFKVLKCFSWKVTVIRAMYERAQLVIWTDASIRIKNPSKLLEYIERAKERGIQQRFQARGVPNPYFTLNQMFDFFGDSPCAHMAFHQVETGYGLYHKEPLVQQAILDPWFGCAVRATCICPVLQRSVQICPDIRGSTEIGVCMRNEQSAISIILAKLFREKYRAVVVNVGTFQVALRENKYPYFDELRMQKG